MHEYQNQQTSKKGFSNILYETIDMVVVFKIELFFVLVKEELFDIIKLLKI